jgi:hypothetical protein
MVQVLLDDISFVNGEVMADPQSREVSDAFWAKVVPLIPDPERWAFRQCCRKPGGGLRP